MKGEYAEEQQEHTSHHHQQHHHQQHYSIPSSTTITSSNPQNANTTQIFPKFLSPPPHFVSPHPQQYHQHQPHQRQYPSESTEITPLEQTPPPTKKPKTATPTTSEDGATIEVSRRPRGRPPGSKNKPKPPIIITREPEPAMSPYILELPSGSDIVDSLTRFTRRRGVGLCVLSASGAVANVMLKQPSTTGPGGTIAFHGRFDILSLSACVMINTVPFNVNSGGFSISLAGPQGQVVGGKVVGSLVCAGTVYVVAASFNSPSFWRLPLEETHPQQQQQLESNNNHEELRNDRVTGGDGQDNSSSPGSGGGAEGDSSGGHMAMYGVHMASHHGGGGDVIWAPTPARSSQAPQQPY